MGLMTMDKNKGDMADELDVLQPVSDKGKFISKQLSVAFIRSIERDPEISNKAILLAVAEFASYVLKANWDIWREDDEEILYKLIHSYWKDIKDAEIK